MSGPGRRIVANLDCEAELARLHRPPLPGGPLPRRVLARLAAAGTLLRAFAREGDRLYLPTALPPGLGRERLPAGLPLPRPELEYGPAARLAPAEATLAWAWTPSARTLAAGSAVEAEPAELEAPLEDLLWRLGRPEPETVARVHGRDFCRRLRQRLGCDLTGSEVLSSARELLAHLRRFESRSPSAAWVLKPLYSAAGRSFHLGGAGRERPSEARAEAWIDRHGSLLFEPWLRRSADFGCALLAGERTFRLRGCHRLLVDARGRFLGLELPAAPAGLADLPLRHGERERLEEVFEAVAGALSAAGYEGPFGIDFFRHIEAGRERLHPLGEVNARMTVGLVARALVDRLREAGGLPGRGRFRLAFGPALPTAGPPVVPLLLPGPEEATACWLEPGS